MYLPDLVEYSRDVQKTAAGEVQARSCPVLTEFAKDYGVVRDQIRAARKALP